MATTLGFHCSHEQLPPSQLLRNLERAAAAGFTAAMCSDHLKPWSLWQGQSVFAPTVSSRSRRIAQPCSRSSIEAFDEACDDADVCGERVIPALRSAARVAETRTYGGDG